MLNKVSKISSVVLNTILCRSVVGQCPNSAFIEVMEQWSLLFFHFQHLGDSFLKSFAFHNCLQNYRKNSLLNRDLLAVLHIQLDAQWLQLISTPDCHHPLPTKPSAVALMPWEKVLIRPYFESFYPASHQTIQQDTLSYKPSEWCS